MSEIMFLSGLICALAFGVCLILTVVMFFALNVPASRRLAKGIVDVKDVESLRHGRAMLTVPAREVKAPATPKPAAAPASPGAVIRTGAKKISEDFIIEKSMIFVSTDEIM